jgi:hypothetical protein
VLALALTLSLAMAPDAGAFADSELGQKRAGENVAALDERWVEGLADGPLLARVERQGDALSLGFYAPAPSPPDSGAPAYVERARFAIPMARQLDAVELRSLGQTGPLLAVTAHADDPDDEPVVLTLVARGPRLVLQQSFLRDPARDPSALALGGPEGFRFADDGGAEVLATSETKRVPVARPDGGSGTVELGQRERRWAWRGDTFKPAGDAYRDFLAPLPLQAVAHPRLFDGKPTTSEKLPLGAAVSARLPAGARLRLLRLVPGCLENEARAKKEPAAQQLSVQLDDGPPLAVEVGRPVQDGRLFGAGQFTLGEGYGSSEMLFFEPPLPAQRLTVTVVGAKGGAAAGCMAEVAAY